MSIAADKPAKRAWDWAARGWTWWRGEMAALWGDAAHALGRARKNAITIEAGERYWLLRQRGRPLGQIDRELSDDGETRRLLQRLAAARRVPIIVEIPQERVLAKRIALPETASGDLDRILAFEIARHFPFPAERVHFRHRVLAGGAPGTIEIEIAAVPRDAIDEISAALDAAGLDASAIALGGGAAPLYLRGTTFARRPRFRRSERRLVASLAVLVLAALAAPILHDENRLADVQQQIDAVRSEAQARLDGLAAEHRAAASVAGPLRLAAARPPMVVVLDALTKAVPDGSWLTSLALNGRELDIAGLSPSAASVALAIEGSGAFTDVTFRAPIARDPKTGLERFALTATVAEPKPAEPKP